MREVGLVDGAALTDILDDDESGLALTLLINKYLIGSTRVVSNTPLRQIIIRVTFWALAANSINAVVITLAVTVERV